MAVLVGAAAGGDAKGVIIVLGAAAAWGLGSVLSHQLALPSHAMLAAAIEMLVGGVVLLAIAAGAGEFSHIAWSAVPVSSWAALAYLIGPGSILAFTAYGYALSHLPAATVCRGTLAAGRRRARRETLVAGRWRARRRWRAPAEHRTSARRLTP